MMPWGVLEGLWCFRVVGFRVLGFRVSGPWLSGGQDKP